MYPPQFDAAFFNVPMIRLFQRICKKTAKVWKYCCYKIISVSCFFQVKLLSVAKTFVLMVECVFNNGMPILAIATWHLSPDLLAQMVWFTTKLCIFTFIIVYCFSESISYEFGPNRGIITYTFPEDRRPEMQEDTISIGFITTKSDAVVLRIVSGTSNDYIELEIVSYFLLFLIFAPKHI